MAKEVSANSPTYYVSVEENCKRIELQKFEILEDAIGLALSLHKVCQPKVSILVETESGTVVNLSYRKAPCLNNPTSVAPHK